MQKFNFFNEVHDFQRFVRENINLIGNYTIISEQLTMRNNETGILDMLAIDNDNNRVTIIELKNELTTDKNIWQPIRYYDLTRRGEDSLKELLFSASNLLECDIESINLEPKVILVVPQCNEQLLRTLSYFQEIDSEVVELKRYKDDEKVEVRKKVFYPTTIYHKEDLVQIKQKISKNWSFEEYTRQGISSQKIKLAKSLINQIKFAFQKKEYEFDMFFTETKITITKNEKVWGHIFIKQKPLDYKLTFSFKIDKEINLNKNNFLYEHYIESVDIKSNSVKFLLNDSMPSNFFNKCI